MSRLMKIVISAFVDLVLIIFYLLNLYPFQDFEYFIYFFVVLLALAFIGSYTLVEKLSKAKEDAHTNYFMKPQ